VQYSCSSGLVTTLTAEMKQAADHDNDSGCGDDSASSYGSSSSSSSSSNGTASELNDTTTAAVIGASDRPAGDNGKCCQQSEADRHAHSTYSTTILPQKTETCSIKRHLFFY